MPSNPLTTLTMKVLHQKFISTGHNFHEGLVAPTGHVLSFTLIKRKVKPVNLQLFMVKLSHYAFLHCVNQ